MSPRHNLKTCRDKGQHFTPPSMKRPSPDPRRQLGTRGVNNSTCRLQRRAALAYQSASADAVAIAEAGTRGIVSFGHTAPRDTENDCHHYKAINHRHDSTCRLSDAVNSRF